MRIYLPLIIICSIIICQCFKPVPVDRLIGFSFIALGFGFLVGLLIDKAE